MMIWVAHYYIWWFGSWKWFLPKSTNQAQIYMCSMSR